MGWIGVDGRGRRFLAVLTLALGCGGEGEAPSEPAVPPEVVEAEEPALPEGVEAPVAEDEGEGGSEGADQAARANDTGAMTRNRWLASYVPGYVSASCRDGFFFRTCFEGATANACARDMRAAIRTCAADSRVGLGDTVDSREQSSRITELMGACAGATYERRLQEAGRRIHNDRCDDPSGWGG
ncbi:MAG: hypothetical protein AAF645_15600 [Myxococcota bacterium]